MTLALVHFRAVDLRYLEMALYSVIWQRGLATHVHEIMILDNDTEESSEALATIVGWALLVSPVPIRVVRLKHGEEAKRCQSWSVNECFRQMRPQSGDDWLLFTRSDYLLDQTLLEKFAHQQKPGAWPRFITSYAYHMAFDERGDQRVEGMRDIEPTCWRWQGTQVLLEQVNGWKVDSSDKDAGVWLTRKRHWEEVGGLNEKLVSWGLQQTVFQQALAAKGVEMVQIPEYLFFHQHHGGTFRDYDRAIAELEQHWGPREQLSSFRDIQGFVGKVCDELDT